MARENKLEYKKGYTSISLESYKKKLEQIYSKHIENEEYIRHSFSKSPKFCHTVKPVNNNLEISNLDELVQCISKSIVNDASNQLDLELKWLESNLYTNANTNDQKKLSADWHLDRRPINWYRIFVLLHETNLSHGPLHYINKDETKKLIKKGFRRGDIYEDKSKIGCMEGNISDNVFINAELCLHKAGIPEKGKKRTILEIVVST